MDVNLKITMQDVAVLFYTVAVFVNGLWLAEPGRPDVSLRIAIVGFAVTLFWTGYFRWKIAPQYLSDEDEESEATEDTGRSLPTEE